MVKLIAKRMDKRIDKRIDKRADKRKIYKTNDRINGILLTLGV